MKEQEIREQLEQLRRELKRNKEEQQVLEKLVSGFEGWLSLQTAAILATTTQMALPTVGEAISAAATPRRKGVSYRQTILQILKDARGEPLHVSDLLRLARDRGANTMAKDPVAITDLVCYSLAEKEPLLRVSAKTWRYATREEVEAWQRTVDPQARRLQTLSSA